MKKKYYLLLFLILIGVILLYIGLFENEQLVGLGTYELLVEQSDGSNLKYVFSTADSYYRQKGCLDSIGDTISGCNIESRYNSTVGGCRVNQIISTGTFYDCETQNSKDACGYGATCDQNHIFSCGIRRCECIDYCSWGEKDYGLRGGIDYESVNGCGWVVKIYSENNTLLKEYSKPQEVDGWISTNGYTTTRISDTSYKIDFPYTINQDSTECYYLKGAVRGARYRYKLCIGNDWSDGDSSHCEDSLIKECILSCPYNKLLNENDCVCEDKPIEPPITKPECVVDLDCSNSSLECQNKVCVPISPPNNHPPNDDKWLFITVCVGILTLFFLIIFLRRK